MSSKLDAWGVPVRQNFKVYPSHRIRRLAIRVDEEVAKGILSDLDKLKEAMEEKAAEGHKATTKRRGPRHCSACGQLGHDCRKCPRKPYTGPPPQAAATSPVMMTPTHLLRRATGQQLVLTRKPSSVGRSLACTRCSGSTARGTPSLKARFARALS